MRGARYYVRAVDTSYNRSFASRHLRGRLAAIGGRLRACRPPPTRSSPCSSLCSLVVGIVAVRLAARVGGPTRRAAYVLPVLAGFGAFYLIGHRLGLSVGPEVGLFGFQVALFGDIAIGFAAALAVALLQAALVRARRPGPGTGAAAAAG